MKLYQFGAIFCLICVTIASCSPTEKSASKSLKKKVIFTQSTDGGKNSIHVIEETTGAKKNIRVVLNKDGLRSDVNHPIDRPNFVISIPLRDTTSSQFGVQTLDFEEFQKNRITRLLAKYIVADRFNVSIRYTWDDKKVEEIQLKSLPLEHKYSKTDNATIFELEKAVKKQKIKVLLDNTLPLHQEQFVKVLIPSQGFFVSSRGDEINVERTTFPKASTISIAPHEEDVIRKKLEKLIGDYVAEEDFVVNVRFALKSDRASSKKKGKKEVMQMEIEVLLNDIVFPEVDEFLKKAIPLSITFVPSRGDSLTITRKQFPEKDVKTTPKKIATFNSYQDKILNSFKTGDYVEGLKLIKEAMNVAFRRQDKIQLLKMKGSLHFLLEERDKARKTWTHVQRLAPDDQEVVQMLNSLEK